MLRRPAAFLAALGAAEGGLVRVDAGTRPVYVVTTHEPAYEVLTVRARSFVKGRMIRLLRPLAGQSLPLADGALHRRQRRMMQPSFHGRAITGYAAAMSRRAHALSGSWRDGQTVALDAELYQLMLAIVAEVMFSLDVAPSLAAEVTASLPTITAGLPLRALLPTAATRVPLPANRRFDDAVRRLRTVVDESVALHGERAEGEQDLLSSMTTARDPDTGDAMSDEQLRDEITNILTGGTESPATTLGWVFHEIGRRPDVERRLHAELDAVVGDREVRAEDLPRLRYTAQVLTEVTRLHTVLVLTRTATEDVRIGDHLLPKGSEVVLSPTVIHRDPRVFPDPEVFDPDRWEPEQARQVPRHAFLPFGMGHRKCIGDSFAFTEMTVVIAAVCSRWRLRPAPGYDPREALALVPNARNLPMQVSARQQG